MCNLRFGLFPLTNRKHGGALVAEDKQQVLKSVFHLSHFPTQKTASCSRKRRSRPALIKPPDAPRPHLPHPADRCDRSFLISAVVAESSAAQGTRMEQIHPLRVSLCGRLD